MQRSKRYLELSKKIDRTKVHSIDEAINLVKETANTKFDGSINVVLKLGIKPQKTDQTVRGSVSLPHGIGKSRKVIVFAEGADVNKAKSAGADEVGGEELAKKIADGWSDFDIAIATPYMMKTVGKLGKILGPMGKMPSPKTGTVTDDIETAVKEFKAGKIEFKNDEGGNLHVCIGKASFPHEKLKENFNSLIEHIKSIKPPTVKGVFLQKVFLHATMGPSIRVDVK